MEKIETEINGLVRFNLDVNEDERGWFKENFQASKMGLEQFVPVQQNISYNNCRGVTRGIHAEPWDKVVSVAKGEVFIAIVDLRPGSEFGTLHTDFLNESTAFFIPRGCGNSFQCLTDEVFYSYLVNDYWSPTANYVHVNLFDEDLAINWPIGRSDAIISDKDAGHPPLSAVRL